VVWYGGAGRPCNSPVSVLRSPVGGACFPSGSPPQDESTWAAAGWVARGSGSWSSWGSWRWSGVSANQWSSAAAPPAAAAPQPRPGTNPWANFKPATTGPVGQSIAPPYPAPAAGVLPTPSLAILAPPKACTVTPANPVPPKACTVTPPTSSDIRQRAGGGGGSQVTYTGAGVLKSAAWLDAGLEEEEEVVGLEALAALHGSASSAAPPLPPPEKAPGAAASEPGAGGGSPSGGDSLAELFARDWSAVDELSAGSAPDIGAVYDVDWNLGGEDPWPTADAPDVAPDGEWL